MTRRSAGCSRELPQRGRRGRSTAIQRPPGHSRPSTWFLWHAHRIRPGDRVLDLACGDGRHSARRRRAGRTVVGVDRDPAKLAQAREGADGVRGLSSRLAGAGSGGAWPELEPF